MWQAPLLWAFSGRFDGEHVTPLRHVGMRELVVLPIRIEERENFLVGAFFLGPRGAVLGDLVDHLEHVGGLPLARPTDRPRAAVNPAGETPGAERPHGEPESGRELLQGQLLGRCGCHSGSFNTSSICFSPDSGTGLIASAGMPGGFKPASMKAVSIAAFCSASIWMLTFP